jgi:hypothetical protein
MLSPIPSPLSLQLTGLIGVVLLAASPAPGQQPTGRGGHPFAGKWSLTLDQNTAPGGATLAIPGGAISPYNCTYHAEKKSFQVKGDGTFAWTENDAGFTHHDGKSPHYTFHGERRLILRASGTVQAPQIAEGASEENRRLTVKLEIICGDGYSTGTSHSGTQTGIGVASADGSQLTNYPGGITVPNPAWAIDWKELKPTSVNDEELGPEIIRRTTTYQTTRQTRIPPEINGLFTPPITEVLEVKHVRYLNLVPRG